MRKPRWMALVVLICVIPQIVLADQIVLKDGTAVTGTVANRGDIAESPELHVVVAILVDAADGPPRLHRYDVREIDYIILEDSGDRRVLDMTVMTKRQPTGETVVLEPEHRRKAAPVIMGALALVAGAAMVTVGVVNKYGEPNCRGAGTSIECDEPPYGITNYSLIGGGILVILGGVVGIAKGFGGP